MLDAAGWGIARVQLVGGPLVVSLTVRHRTNQGNVLHLLSHQRPVLGDPDTRHGCLDRPGRTAAVMAGLGIECFELAGPALHPKDNY